MFYLIRYVSLHVSFSIVLLSLIIDILYHHKQEYNAKLSDFGLAKDGPTGDKSHVSTRVMGTYGYAAPEYLATGMQTSVFALNFLTLKK